MSDLVTKLRELDAKATKGPWEVRDKEPANQWPFAAVFTSDGWFVAEMDHAHKGSDKRNAALIVALRNALPALIEYVEAAEQNVGALKTVLLLTGSDELSCLEGYERAKADLEAALEGRHE